MFVFEYNCAFYCLNFNKQHIFYVNVMGFDGVKAATH